MIMVVRKALICMDLCNLKALTISNGKLELNNIIIHSEPSTEPNNNMITDVITNGLLALVA